MGWAFWASDASPQRYRSVGAAINAAPYEAHRRSASGTIRSVAATVVDDDRGATEIRAKQRRILADYVCHTRTR
jgi:hypothetical protein